MSCSVLARSQYTKIPTSPLVESFLDSLSPYDSSVLRDVLGAVSDSSRFSDSVESRLVSTLSRFGLRKSDNIKCCLAQTARFEFLLKPAVFISATFSGVPSCHKPTRNKWIPFFVQCSQCIPSKGPLNAE